MARGTELNKKQSMSVGASERQQTVHAMRVFKVLLCMDVLMLVCSTRLSCTPGADNKVEMLSIGGCCGGWERAANERAASKAGVYNNQRQENNRVYI